MGGKHRKTPLRQPEIAASWGENRLTKKNRCFFQADGTEESPLATLKQHQPRYLAIIGKPTAFKAADDFLLIRKVTLKQGEIMAIKLASEPG